MDNFPQGYRESSCEKCCEYNDRDQKEIKRLTKELKVADKIINEWAKALSSEFGGKAEEWIDDAKQEAIAELKKEGVEID